MKNYQSIASLGCLALLASGATMAADLHDNEVRIGAYLVKYAASASDLYGPYVPGGVNIDVKDVNTIYLAYTRTLSEHYVLEVAFGVPPKTDTIGKGPASLGSVPYKGEVISTAKWFAPTVLINHVFGDESARFRPYLGVGVNFTHFYDRQSTAAGDAASGGPTSISLSNSVGPSATAGVSWRLTERLHAYGSYSITKVSSEFVGNTAGVYRTTHIDFKPSAWVISVGYAF